MSLKRLESFEGLVNTLYSEHLDIVNTQIHVFLLIYFNELLHLYAKSVF